MIGRRARRTIDIWPGFVDALSGLLMVIIFVLLVFVLAQYFLGNALSGSEAARDRLGREMAALAEQLSLEKKANDTLHADLSKLNTQLTTSDAEREKLGRDVAALEALKAELEGKLAQMGDALEGEKTASMAARAEAALLNQQLDTIRQEMARIAAALDASEKQSADQKVQIADLGKRLNVALANKVEELQRYRSEFFGKLRQVLGNRPGIRVEGDRFVFQSEVLFDTASAEMGVDGIEQMRQLAKTLNEISKQIPKDVNWVLRVDGHTDKRPIASGRFPSNWELSTARAITVVKTLAANGVPADHLAAAGFGEFQPLDKGETEDAFAKNRRIEIRLDAR
ncbi:MAG: peptidoglycan -binding protein [Bacteroidota bacterium]